jgi:hypothetical protein
MTKCSECEKESDIFYTWLRVAKNRIFCSWKCLGTWCDSLSKEGEKK